MATTGKKGYMAQVIAVSVIVIGVLVGLTVDKVFGLSSTVTSKIKG